MAPQVCHSACRQDTNARQSAWLFNDLDVTEYTQVLLMLVDCYAVFMRASDRKVDSESGLVMQGGLRSLQLCKQ